MTLSSSRPDGGQPEGPRPAGESVGGYLAAAAVLVVVALLLAGGATGWTPSSTADWLVLVALAPAGVGGALLGDRGSLWLKERGFGRQ